MAELTELPALSFRLVAENLCRSDRASFRCASKDISKAVEVANAVDQSDKLERLKQNVHIVVDIGNELSCEMHLLVKMDESDDENAKTYLAYSFGNWTDGTPLPLKLRADTFAMTNGDWQNVFIGKNLLFKPVFVRSRVLLSLCVRVYDELLGLEQLGMLQGEASNLQTLKERLNELLKGITFDQLYSTSDLFMQKPVVGGTPMVRVLGRQRRILIEGKKQYVTYKGAKVLLSTARKLEAKSLKK